ncbi:MAG: hypothetical protein LBD94_03100 [Rickettsiales bacterium]|jgi:hypothetical protein|nr:hypothetical protein [Rickettsiales bacterium]
MSISNPTYNEFECAVSWINFYREEFGAKDLEDKLIEDDVLNLDRCRYVVGRYKEMQKKIADSAMTESLSTGPAKENLWFMHGPKSERFAEEVRTCSINGNYGELDELQFEITKMRNRYAKERYQKIFDYVTRCAG